MMFNFADTDGDGQLSYGEFLKVINPPKPDIKEDVEEKKVVIEKESDLEGENEGEDEDQDQDRVVANHVVQCEDKEDAKVVKFVDEMGKGNGEKIQDEKESDDK